jgi:hypothetical protein
MGLDEGEMESELWEFGGVEDADLGVRIGEDGVMDGEMGSEGVELVGEDGVNGVEMESEEVELGKVSHDGENDLSGKVMSLSWIIGVDVGEVSIV